MTWQYHGRALSPAMKGRNPMGIFTDETAVREGCCPSCHQIFGGCWCSASEDAVKEAKRLHGDN